LEQRFLGEHTTFPDTLPPSITHLLTIVIEQSHIPAHQRTLLSCLTALLEGAPNVAPSVIAAFAETSDASSVVNGSQPSHHFRCTSAIFLTELIQRLLFAKLVDSELRLGWYEDLLASTLERVASGGVSATKYLHLLIGLLRGVDTLPILLPAVTAVNDRRSIIAVLTEDLDPGSSVPMNTFPFADRLCAIGKAALHVMVTIDTLNVLWRVCHTSDGCVIQWKRDLFLHWVADLCAIGAATPFEAERVRAVVSFCAA
jgi:hypothetical protein